ncbi:hypothetical protein [Sphaerisporangium corydalis]|uniref:ATP-binding protein n=1 Tax=Sphaerisporangium corydalis TaxID=1441875 RepID=A0ABV9EWE3_9ACTN|nr:hypothetical protein [Sphaerisporangium corydalis]
MTSWLGSPVFSLGMIVGEVGAGKTRTAIQLIRKAQHDGWNAELLAGKSSPGRTTGEQLRRLSMLNTPTLIVIDNAELKPVSIVELASNLAYNHGIPVRLLMLARSAGWWWKELQHQLPAAAVSDVQVLGLEHVTNSGHNAIALFAAAVESFDQRINKDSLLVTEPSILSASNDAYFGPESAMTILNLHLRALRWVLAISSPETRDEPEAALLSNELQHISRACRSNGIRMHFTRLETILAAAVLYGASTRAEAEQLMGSMPGLDVDDGLLLTDIIQDFYPSREGDFFSPLGIGALNDRLLTTNVLQNGDALLSPMTKLTRLQQMRALTTLFRLAAEVPKVGEVMAAYLNERTGDIRFELAASAGLAVGQPGVIENVLRRAYPSQSDRIRDVVAATSGSSQGDNVSTGLWHMYVGAFAPEDTGGVDIGPAYDAIELALDDIDKCRSTLEEALATVPTLSNFLEDYLSNLYESSRSLSRLADRINHAEEDPQTIRSLSRKLSLTVEELHPILAETAEVLRRDIRKLSAFQEEGLSQIAAAVRDLAGALDELEQAVPVNREKDED